MIEPLTHTAFEFLVSLTYFIIFIIISKVLGIFRIIGSLKFAVLFANKLNSIKIVNDFRLKIWNRFNVLINSKLFMFRKRIVSPVFYLLSRLLSIISQYIYDLENIVAIHISKSIIEVITEICLICRNTINTKVQNLWSIMIIFFVLIYFILTM